MKNRMIALFNLLSATLLGISLTLAFAPYDIFPLAIIAPALLLMLWLDVSRMVAFWRGYMFGLGFFGSGVYWVYISIHYFGGVDIPLAIFVTSGFVAFLALFPATVGYLLNRYFPQTNSSKILCAFPAIWLFSEWVRSWIFTGFPWLLLGYSQTHTPLKGYAPIFSVYGVSLAVMLSSALAVRAYQYFKIQNYRALYSQLLAFAMLWIIGGLLSLIPWTKPDGKPVSVSLVQGNVPQSIKWSPSHLQLSLDRYEELTSNLWDKNKLIIWPESAVPTTLQEAAGYINKLNDIAIKNNTQLLIGIPIETPEPDTYYNAIISLGKEQQVYTKRLLVPFGEFTPYNKYVGKLFSFLHIPMSSMLPGKFDQKPFIFGHLKILPAICYEIAFPELMATYDKSVGMLLTITNDAWYGKSAAQAQHLEIAEMRALELKRPVLFVSNDGITAIINEDGNIVKSIPPYEIGVLSSDVTARYGLTPWMRNKMAPVQLILLYLLFVAIREKYKKPKTNEAVLNTIQLTEK